MIQEIKDFITITLAKRLSSPFLSSFIFAWCITNYDITLLIFSGSDWNTKVTYISGVFNSLTWSNNRFLYPLYTSLFYIVVWPALDMVFYTMSKYWSILYKNVQMRLEKITPITHEERKLIEVNYIENMDALRKDISTKSKIITDLESKINELESPATQLVNSDKEQKSTNDSGSSTEGVRKPIEDSVDKNEYTFHFGVSNNLRKIYSKNDKEIKQRTKIIVSGSMISKEAWAYIHNIYYDDDTHTMPRELDLNVIAWDKQTAAVVNKEFIYDNDVDEIDPAEVATVFMNENRAKRRLADQLKNLRETEIELRNGLEELHTQAQTKNNALARGDHGDYKQNQRKEIILVTEAEISGKTLALKTVRSQIRAKILEINGPED